MSYSCLHCNAAFEQPREYAQCQNPESHQNNKGEKQ